MTDPSLQVHRPSPLWRRLAGFTLLPVISAVSPLVVLPLVARATGSAGWASALSGEAIGTFAGIAIAFGWGTIGPAWTAAAASGEERGRLYRESLVVRSVVTILVLPLLAVLAATVATPGFELLAVLMGVQGALIALSFTWFAVGLGKPASIALYDAVPRVAVAVLAALAIAAGAPVELYPVGGIAVTLVGTGLYSAGILRRYRASWPSPNDVRESLRRSSHVAANEAALGLYSAIPVPLATLIAPGLGAAGYASADKLVKLGQFVPLSLANALQSWTAEGAPAARARRVRLALLAHTGLGVVAAVCFAVLGNLVSVILFGEEAAASSSVLALLGLAFAAYSVRTSLARHLLFPAGESPRVLRATIIATLVGLPLMVGLGAATPLGPVGVAVGYALIEVLSTVLLLSPSKRAFTALAGADLEGAGA